MKFLVDSCISSFAVKELREAGFETLWIPETGHDPGDKEIIQKAYSENYILVTADKDFGELVFALNMPCPTIIRLVNILAKEQGKILLKALSKYQTDIHKKSLITIEKFRVRIKTPNSNAQ